MQSAHEHRTLTSSRLAILCVAFLICVSIAAPAIAAPGDFDASFHNGGLVFTEIARPAGFWQKFYPYPRSMLVQPDGKILVAGTFWEDGIASWYGTVLVRYMPDGTLDSSFGSDGIVTVIDYDYPYFGQAVGADLALQEDGKIVLIGEVPIAYGILIRRYTSDGQLDTSFGQDGTTRVRGKLGGQGNSIAIQPDGKIVGTGWEYDPHSNPYYDAIVLFRLNEDGLPDRSFGPDGSGTLLIEQGYDGARILIQRDGKILLAGTLAGELPPAILLMRYDSDGSPDSSFGSGGTVTYRDGGIDYVSAAALQSDGKIIVADWKRGLFRFDTDGSLDSSFAVNGVARFESGFRPISILMQRNDRIIVVGNTPNESTAHDDFTIFRLTPDGSRDRAFGLDGRAVYPINAGGTNFADATAAALQPDGNIVVAGAFGHYLTDSHEEIALARFLAPVPRVRPVRMAASGR